MCPKVAGPPVTSAATPTICPKQTYQDTMASGKNILALISVESCKPCPPGYFSGPGFEYCQPVPAGFTPNSNPSDPAILNVCAEGTYSDWGYSSCQTCPDGLLCPAGGEMGPHYGCPRGSFCIAGVQHLCDPGQFGLIDRARSKTEGCADCPAGYYCLPGTTDFNLYPCPLGMYCPVATEVPKKCPKGTFNDRL